MHLNSVVLPNDSQCFDDPAFHDLLATEFPARASLEQFFEASRHSRLSDHMMHFRDYVP